jgi:3-hydroxyacyl-CoA dehydrogenase
VAIETITEKSIAVLRIAHPPMNVLSIGAGVVSDLLDAVEAALADPAVSGIVIAGGGKLFSAGADIKDFENDLSEIDGLRALFDTIENAPKPIVAAIHGMALGGGLELALACHYRIAATGSKLGLPEVTLGILPGGGGTQRLPRLVPAKDAIALMIGGKPIDADRALAIGLIDRIADGDVAAAASAFLTERPPVRPTGALALSPGADEAIAAARATLKPGALNQAPAAILDCVAAAAAGDLRSGLTFEAARVAELMVSEASLGLRHAFFGQRIVTRIPGLPPGTTPIEIGRVAVIGGGLMGTGIATALLNAGLPVTLIEPQDAARDRAAATIGKTIDRDVQKGRLSAEAAAQRIACLTLSGTLDAAAGADLAIEAVFEDMAVKEQVFGALDRIMAPHAILASNTSTLDLDTIAGFTTRPDRVVGLHFFSPANIMKLLEIVRGARTAPAVLATAMAFAKRIGKIGVVAGVCDGFIGNRIFEEYLRQAYFLAEEGALPQRIDAALEAWGMAMGPFRTMDLAGQDIGWSIRRRRAIEHPDRPYSGFPDRVCELGRFGQKTGKGVYLYPDGRTAVVDPEIDALLIVYSAERGIERRTIGDEEIVERCLLAMINEGARIVAEGVAYRPVDIDIIYLNGYGFPTERGGPMHYADRIGLPQVVARIDALAKGREGWVWDVSPLLRDLAARGVTLDSLNG